MVAITKIILSATVLASASAAAIRRLESTFQPSSDLFVVSDPVLNIDTDLFDGTDDTNSVNGADDNDTADTDNLDKRATSTATGVSSSSKYGTEQVDDPVLQTSAAPKKTTSTTTTTKVQARQTAAPSSTASLVSVTSDSVFGKLVVGDPVLTVDTDGVVDKVPTTTVSH